MGERILSICSVEITNIRLGADKPKWYQEKLNPLGGTPALLLSDGTVLWDSQIVSEYLDSLESAQAPLFSRDPAKKAQQRMKCEQLAKV